MNEWCKHHNNPSTCSECYPNKNDGMNNPKDWKEEFEHTFRNHGFIPESKQMFLGFIDQAITSAESKARKEGHLEGMLTIQTTLRDVDKKAREDERRKTIEECMQITNETLNGRETIFAIHVCGTMLNKFKSLLPHNDDRI